MLYFVAFEDATVMLYDTKTNQVIDWFKRSTASENEAEEDQPALLAIDSRPVLTVDKLEARQFVISEPSCIYLLYYDPINQLFHLTNRVKDLKK
jgi:hypothetical protein